MAVYVDDHENPNGTFYAFPPATSFADRQAAEARLFEYLGIDAAIAPAAGVGHE